MGDIQRFVIEFENQRTVFTPGEQVTGRVHLVLNESMNVRCIQLEATGRALTHSRTRSRPDSNDQSQTGTSSVGENYLNTVITLKGQHEGAPGDEPVMTPGTYEFPFSFHLPSNCPTSFEAPDGCIRYTCKAAIIGPEILDLKCTVPFTVVCIVDLNRNLEAQKPIPLNQTQRLGCMFCCGGTLECRGSIPRGGFVPGESIPLNFEIFNKSKAEVSEVTVNFAEQLIYSPSQQTITDLKFRKRQITTLEGARIARGYSQNWTGRTMHVPPLAPSMTTDDYFDLTYNLTITVTTSGCYNDMEIFLPIVIGSIPLRSVYQNVAQENVISAQPRPTAPPIDGDFEPSAPLQSYGEYPDLPPPTYEEAVLGGGQMQGNDSCPATFKPKYPYFGYLNKNK